MAAPAPPTLLSVVRQRLFRLQLMAGMGGLAAMAGGVIASPLVVALLPWAQAHRSSWTVGLVHILISRFWVYLILPGLWFLAARLFSQLNPWSTAVGSALVGELFYLALDWVGGSLASLVHMPALWFPRLATLALGVFLSQRAISYARPS